MTKIQKIWMGIFIAMFAVPEILWSPIGNFIYSFLSPTVGGNYQLLRNNFLFDYRFENLLKFLVFIQSIGIVLFLIFLLKNKSAIKSKILFWTILFVGFLICFTTLFVFYLAVIFNPSLVM